MNPLTNGQDYRLMVGMDIGSANITCAIGQANSSTKTNISMYKSIKQQLTQAKKRARAGRVL